MTLEYWTLVVLLVTNFSLIFPFQPDSNFLPVKKEKIKRIYTPVLVLLSTCFW